MRFRSMFPADWDGNRQQWKHGLDEYCTMVTAVVFVFQGEVPQAVQVSALQWCAGLATVQVGFKTQPHAILPRNK